MTIGMSGYMRVEDMLTARVNELTADLIHEREAHAETQAALRAFIVDLDRANAALILAKEALAGLIAMDDYGMGVTDWDAHFERARTALGAIKKLEGANP